MRPASFILWDICGLAPCALRPGFSVCLSALAGRGPRIQGRGSSAAGKSKGPRRALALCVGFEAVSNLSDALGFGCFELAQQIFYLPTIFALGFGLKNSDDCLNFVEPQIHVDLDLAHVCV